MVAKMAESDNLVLITLRLPLEQAERIEDWRRRHRKIPAMTAALRALLDRGLATEPSAGEKAA
jgi:hypothetical protein